MTDNSVILGYTEDVENTRKKPVKLDDNGDGTYSLCVSLKDDQDSSSVNVLIGNLITVMNTVNTNITTLNTNISTMITNQNTLNT